MTDEKAKKTLIFYGGDSKAAREKHKIPVADSVQYVQADAYEGERMEADEIEFMDDVDAGQRARIESLWGKFDNRISHDPAKVGGASLMSSDPASNRANLTSGRLHDPAKVEPDQLKHSGVAEKAGTNPTAPGSLNQNVTGLDGVTGKPAVDRDKIVR